MIVRESFPLSKPPKKRITVLASHTKSKSDVASSSETLSPCWPTYYDCKNHDIRNSTSATNRTASRTRIMTSLRKSLLWSAHKNLMVESVEKTGMITTKVENTPPDLFQLRDFSSSSSPPTIEQIAMGLHRSRTPHFRPLSSPYSQCTSSPGSSYPHTCLYDGQPSHSQPHFPSQKGSASKHGSSRSSSAMNSGTLLPGWSQASVSSTTVISQTTQPSNSFTSTSFLKFHIPHIFPKMRNLSFKKSVPSRALTSCDNSKLLHTKKEVRFSGQALEDSIAVSPLPRRSNILEA